MITHVLADLTCPPATLLSGEVCDALERAAEKQGLEVADQIWRITQNSCAGTIVDGTVYYKAGGILHAHAEQSILSLDLIDIEGSQLLREEIYTELGGEHIAHLSLDRQRRDCETRIRLTDANSRVVIGAR